MATNKSTSFLTDFSTDKRSFGFYLVGSLVIILFSFLGQVPMLLFFPDNAVASNDPFAYFSHLDSNLTLLLFLIPSLIAFFAFLFVIKYIHKQTLQSVTTVRKQIDVKRIIFGFVFWGVLSVLIFGISLILSPENYKWNFELQPFLTMFIIASLLIPFQSALEEWIFRGYLMQGFATMTRSRILSLFLTSIIFGSLHILNPEIDKLGYGLLAYYIGSGLFFGIVALMDEGIELAIGIHVANNLVTAILVTANWTAFQTASLYKDISTPNLMVELSLSLLLIYPLSIFILARKYKWKNWKEKLIVSIDGE
jgi:membrane protease YdiL (CAAX protease family)